MEKKTGIVVPLGALYTKECEACGDFLSLKSFADFCEKSNLGIIQLLPVNDTGTQSSPYSGLSAFALHPIYIRIEALPEFQDAFKSSKTFKEAYKNFQSEFPYSDRYDYEKLNHAKNNLLHLLYEYIEKKLVAEEKKFKKEGFDVAPKDSFSEKFKSETQRFIKKNPWIEIYSVFKNIKDIEMQASWKEWPEELRTLNRDQIKLRWNNKALKSSHNFFVWCQLRAAEQFKEASEYIKSKNIILKGDIPILMNEDSADAWAWPEYFSHDHRAGSPPDGENPVGQNWGFPTYNWENLSLDSYSWWKNRIKTSAEYYSAFRIDHILGFFRIWAVNANDTTAYLGHTMPFEGISRKTLEEKGFSNDRLTWLSKSHIPTGLIESITWNHDEATAMLEKVCNRVNNEELWIFKDSISGDKLIYQQRFCDDDGKDMAVKNALSQKWRDRALIEVSEDVFVPVYKYYESTAWNTLNDGEKHNLEELFAKCHEKEDELWKKQAINVLTPICGASDMVPCAEDLGVNLKVLPEVLEKLSILSLRVIRWSRKWSEGGQPYIPFNEYPELSVSTTSVHDSPTLRQWWLDEKSSVEAFLYQNRAVISAPEGSLFDREISKDDPFNETTAKFCLEASAKSNSAWFINPLQDYLYLSQKYYKENPMDERINVPGTVNQFNWTYRIPCKVEELLQDKDLIEKICDIASKHN